MHDEFHGGEIVVQEKHLVERRTLGRALGLKQQAGINVNINWDNFFLNLIREGFNIRNYHEIIETDRMDDRVSPDMEIKILEQGGEIRVNVNDDDQAHKAPAYYLEDQRSNPAEALEDAQWADSATLDAVKFVARP